MKRNRQKKELEEVKNEDEKSSENEEEKKVFKSSLSKRLQNEVSALLLHYYKEGITVDEVIKKTFLESLVQLNIVMTKN